MSDEEIHDLTPKDIADVVELAAQGKAAIWVIDAERLEQAVSSMNEVVHEGLSMAMVYVEDDRLIAIVCDGSSAHQWFEHLSSIRQSKLN